MKVVIIGASGFLGKKLMNYFSKKHDVIGTYSKNEKENLFLLDATNLDVVKNFLHEHKPDVVIDTVAFSSSVACEKNPELAEKINYETAKIIADVCKEIEAKMIFLSSNYAFDGERGDYTESDPTNPTNEYGRTKVMAEKAISNLENSIILRTGMVYGLDEGKIKFGTSTFEKEVIEVGHPNQLRKPIFIDDIPKIIDVLLQKDQKGIFHISGPNKITMLEFLKKLGSVIGQEDKVKIVDTTGWVLNPPRKPTLDISKIESLGIKTTPLEEALKIIENKL